MPDEKRKGLLGCAIQRQNGTTGEKDWLSGQLAFPGQTSQPAGAQYASNVASIQKFRWADYRVYPDTSYSYTVPPVYGMPDKLDIQDGPTVTVRTASVNEGTHRVLFNRAAGFSQAFSRKFPDFAKKLAAAVADHYDHPDQPIDIELPLEVKAWLSRGMVEMLTGFIAKASDSSWALDITIYQYSHPDIVKAVNDAFARGVNVRVVYHNKTNDEDTAKDEANLATLPDSAKRGRKTSKIMHHKFIVCSRLENGKRVPQAVI